MSLSIQPVFGGIEAGGTKFICAVGTAVDDLREVIRIPTTSPEETIGLAIEFFRQQGKLHPVAAVGIGAFGPLDLDAGSPAYGSITVTPKPGWRYTSLYGMVRDGLRVPVVVETDVNAAALGEREWGAGRDCDTFIYLTVGTGIGGGGFINSRLLHGLGHPEMGHIRIPHDFKRDPFPGACPFHGDCLEGLASGAAMEKRWGQRPESIPLDHPAWTLEADYLAMAIANYIYTLSPQRILIGGGIMQNLDLLPRIRQRVHELLNNYIASAELIESPNHYIVSPQLGNLSGVLGAIAMARQLNH